MPRWARGTHAEGSDPASALGFAIDGLPATGDFIVAVERASDDPGAALLRSTAAAGLTFGARVRRGGVGGRGERRRYVRARVRGRGGLRPDRGAYMVLGDGRFQSALLARRCLQDVFSGGAGAGARARGGGWWLCDRGGGRWLLLWRRSGLCLAAPLGEEHLEGPGAGPLGGDEGLFGVARAEVGALQAVGVERNNH